MDQYKYIATHHGETERINCKNPLSLPSKHSNIWDEIRQQVKDYFLHEKGEDIFFNENEFNLISGTVNLINHIIENNQTEPIKTLIFLDKTARLGAHIFRVLWSILEKQGKIPSGISMPTIKYVNIGRFEDHKHGDNRALGLAKQVFPKDALKGNGVLVVDEFISSGGSVRRAMKTFNDIYGSNAHGIANFIDLPSWYGANDRKGVEDPNLSKDVYTYLEQIDKDVFDFLFTMIKNQKNEDFITQFFFDAEEMNFEDFVTKYSTDTISTDLLKKIYLVLQTIPFGITEKSIIRYFRSFGGFLALRPDREWIATSREYRGYLIKMVELASKHISAKQKKES